GESKTTALNFITETKTNFISWAAEVGESVGGIFSGAFARRTPEQVRETLETVGEIFNASVEGLTVIAGSAGGAAGELIKQGLTIGAHGFDIVQEAAFIFIDENGADIKDWATATSKTIANSFDNAKTVISVAGGVINNTLEKNKDEIAETFAGFGTSAAQAFMGYSKIGAETLETVTGVVAKFAVDNEDKLQDFTDNAVEIFTVMGGTVNKISQETTEKVLEHWDNGGRDTVESVAEMATDVGGWFLDLSNEFVMPAVVEMFTEMENIWDRSLGDVVSETFGFVSDIGVLMKLLWDDYIKPVIDWLLSYIIPRIMNFATTVIGTVGWIVSAIGESIKGFIGIFRGLIQFFTGIFSGDWEKAWEGIKKVFTSIWDAIKGVVLSIVNAIIGLINGLVRSVVNGINAVIGIINKVNFTIPDWVPGIGGKEIGWSVAPVEAPQIPYLAFAQGGVVDPNDPFLAMLGDNRHEQEVVSPLSTIKQALAEALQEASGGGQNVTIEFTGSGAELVELLAPKIIDRANSLSAQYGYSVVRA
ncbi:MAG: hypothetical protein FWE82_07265, partial [Defluviitaleaceae bacterium]|nr:hypothetical protein [Defluviitaleaceae bacterium]